MITGPHRLRERLTAAGAVFEVVGSVAAGALDPTDLDIAVPADEIALARLLEVIDQVGGRSLLSSSMPSPARVVDAGMWQFSTPDAGLDVFVGTTD